MSGNIPCMPWRARTPDPERTDVKQRRVTPFIAGASVVTAVPAVTLSSSLGPGLGILAGLAVFGLCLGIALATGFLELGWERVPASPHDDSSPWPTIKRRTRSYLGLPRRRPRP